MFELNHEDEPNWCHSLGSFSQVTCLAPCLIIRYAIVQLSFCYRRAYSMMISCYRYARTPQCLPHLMHPPTDGGPTEGGGVHCFGASRWAVHVK